MTAPHDAVRDMLALSGTRPRWPGTRSLAETDAARLCALLPLGVALVLSDSWAGVLNAFVHAALVVLGAQLVCARLRGRRMETGGLATAAAMALLLPDATPLLHLMLGALVGVVLGELIFGGRGWSFLNPAVVGLVFVYFSSSTSAPSVHVIAPWAVAAGGAALLALGLAEWRTTLAALAVLGVAAALAGQALEAFVWNGNVLFVVVFLCADPAAVPSTRGARWLFGAMVALLATALSAHAGVPDPRALVFAIMLGAVFAPLLDSVVLALYDWRARRAS